MTNGMNGKHVSILGLRFRRSDEAAVLSGLDNYEKWKIRFFDAKTLSKEEDRAMKMMIRYAKIIRKYYQRGEE